MDGQDQGSCSGGAPLRALTCVPDDRQVAVAEALGVRYAPVSRLPTIIAPMMQVTEEITGMADAPQGLVDRDMRKQLREQG